MAKGKSRSDIRLSKYLHFVVLDSAKNLNFLYLIPVYIILHVSFM